MASTHKTFTEETLTPADVNNALNPTTADHIPYAVASGTASFPMAGASALGIVVTFPAGRFTRAPVVVATVGLDSAATDAAVCIAHTISATQCQLRLQCTAATGATVPVSWIAIQQDA